MKQIFLTSAIALTLIACGGSGTENKEQKKEEPKVEAAADPTANPDYENGLVLVAQSNCLTCHKVDEKLIGPAYREVANKYENNEANIKMLAEKVIKGGTGVWGQVAMAPHPEVTLPNAEAMVKYILLLKNK